MEEMKEIKTIVDLVERAGNNKSGFARVRARMNYGWGQTGNLEEKYSIRFSEDERFVTLKHWGTVTLVLDLEDRRIVQIYGESNSDRDSINTLLNLYGFPFHTHYYPSREEFELHSRDEEIIQINEEESK